MHQIRVHLAHIGCPVVGDRLYGRASSERGFHYDDCMTRLALHAARLVFPNPANPDERLTVEAPAPEDMCGAWKAMKRRATRGRK